jgi:aryl-alcohol dehydrogenase-like predicted oxidoreductase
VGEAKVANEALVAKLAEFASAKGITLAQLSLAWVMAQGHDVVPIPGTKRRRWLAENIAAGDVVLTADEVVQVSALVPRDAVAGERYPSFSMGTVNV